MKRTYLAQIIGRFVPFAVPMIGHMVTFLHMMKGDERKFPSLRLCPYLQLKLLFSLVNTA